MKERRTTLTAGDRVVLLNTDTILSWTIYVEEGCDERDEGKLQNL